MMRITIDHDADAAYIQITDHMGAGAVAKTYSCDPAEVGGTINLDFDGKGRLLGIELVAASQYLQP